MRMQLRWHRVLPVVVGLIIFGLALGVSPAKEQTKTKKSSKHMTAGHPSSAQKTHTRTASLKRKHYYRRSRKARGQQAPTADRISEIQTALAKDGSYAGSPSGKWDSATVEAMKKFQAAHGLSPTGKLDALTLQRLGLGSATAGVAAPYPPTGTADAGSEPETASTGSARKE